MTCFAGTCSESAYLHPELLGCKDEMAALVRNDRHLSFDASRV